MRRIRSQRAVHWGIAVALGAAAAILLLAAFTAQGTPAATTAQLSGPLNAVQSQSLQLTLTTQVLSLQPPNSIDLLGGHFLYSISQTNAQNGLTVIAQSQSVAFNVVSSAGSSYTVSATVSVSTVASCSGTGCPGVTENLTVTVQAILSTYWGVHAGPTNVIVFSTTPTYNTNQGMPAVPVHSFYMELLGPILGAVVFGLLATAAARPNRMLLEYAGIATVLDILILAGLGLGGP